jgi:hypothetical protein
VRYAALAIANDRYFIDRFAQVIWEFTPTGLMSQLTTALVNKIMDA